MAAVVASTKKWTWQTWALVGLGGVAAIATGGFIAQAKYAALGRQVHRNVTKFLIDNGARVESGVISGGIVSIPMKTNIAVNSTVVSLLNTFSDQSGGRPPLNPATAADEPEPTGPRATAAGRPKPSARGRASSGSAPATGVRKPSASPDDGGYEAREGQKAGDCTYNPAEFVPKGVQKPAQEVDLFADA